MTHLTGKELNRREKAAMLNVRIDGVFSDLNAWATLLDLSPEALLNIRASLHQLQAEVLRVVHGMS